MTEDTAIEPAEEALSADVVAEVKPAASAEFYKDMLPSEDWDMIVEYVLHDKATKIQLLIESQIRNDERTLCVTLLELFKQTFALYPQDSPLRADPIEAAIRALKGDA
jgi:hypothetical protein